MHCDNPVQDRQACQEKQNNKAISPLPIRTGLLQSPPWYACFCYESVTLPQHHQLWSVVPVPQCKSTRGLALSTSQTPGRPGSQCRAVICGQTR